MHSILRIVTRPFRAFLRLEAASGIVLLGAAALAMVWASASSASYAAVFTPDVQGGVNDGLMTLFFLVVGMEIKRELVDGELDSPGKAILPAVAALGGMLVPACIYAAFNHGGAGARGWAIPVATDVAFSVGVLTMVRGRVPDGLLVFVTALAIVDDIGGILVIALFYGHGLHAAGLGIVAACGAALLAANRLRVEHWFVYAALCAPLWYGLHLTGVHPTMAGVLVGLAIPGRSRALDRLVTTLHPLVAFAVMPTFALANAGVSLAGTTLATLASPVALGTAFGLFAGKAVGIFGATSIAVRARVAGRPGDATPGQLLGASFVAGIGFTVALFIATLAFAADPLLLNEAKLGIVCGSLLSGGVGFVVLRLSPQRWVGGAGT